jgi:hypothetical protein
MLAVVQVDQDLGVEEILHKPVQQLNHLNPDCLEYMVMVILVVLE